MHLKDIISPTERSYLLIRGNNDYHHDGDQIPLSQSVLRIGESSNSDIRIEPIGGQPYALIIRQPEGTKRWVAIRTSRRGVALSAGNPLEYMDELHSGSMISIEQSNLSLKFCRRKEWSPIVWILLALLFASVFSLFLLLFSDSKTLTNEKIWKELSPLESSIYRLVVDSIEQSDSTRIKLENPMCGTAFLTSKGSLITARHCLDNDSAAFVHLQLINATDTFDVWTSEVEMQWSEIAEQDWAIIQLPNRKGKIHLAPESLPISPQSSIYIMGYLIKNNSDRISKDGAHAELQNKSGPNEQIEIDKQLDEGYSGSPVFMMVSKDEFVCIGIVKGGDNRTWIRTYATPINDQTFKR